MEEGLNTKGKGMEADAVVGEGNMGSLPRMRSMPVPISPSHIIPRISTAGSVLQKSRRYGITKVNSLYLKVRIRVIPLQSRNLMSTSVSCL